MPPFKNPQEQRFNAKQRDTIQNSEPHSDMQTGSKRAKPLFPLSETKPSRDTYHVALWWRCCVSAGDHCLNAVDVIPCLLQMHTHRCCRGSRRDFYFYLPHVFIFDSTLSSYIKDSLQIIVTVHRWHPLKGNNYILIRHLWAGLRGNPATGDE